MSVVTVLLLLMIVGIAICVKTGKLSAPTVVICISCGLLLGTTSLGDSIAGGIESAGSTVIDSLAGVLS